MNKQVRIPNIIGGERVECGAARIMDVLNPATGEIIGVVPMSTAEDLDRTVKAAAIAQKEWARTPLKDRVQVLFKLKGLIEERKEALAEVVTLENGKLIAESYGSILRAVECVEFATSLPQLAPGSVLEVSAGVECKLIRQPLGVVAGITPFNFPFMVPFWMLPLALASGNAFILKPSEQTPLSAIEISKLLDEAGLPAGLYSVVHGDQEIVEAICDHPGIAAIGFVGSTKVAKKVYERASKTGKRVRALGGAKNHLVLVPDADPEMAASNVVASVTGCAGQRCMAASVLLAVGDVEHIIERIRSSMAALIPGKDIGPIISRASLDRITGYLERAETNGAKLLLDGRNATAENPGKGFYMGASIIDQASPEHESCCDEIFGPVLTIIRCKTLDEAIALENASPYGNAAAIYTSSGKAAQYFSERAESGMIGVNIGVPVPREPFAFGGWNQSGFGDGDLTAYSAIEFWSRAKKITTKWEARNQANWMS